MDVNRAKQIINSTKEISVHYNNTPVWIQNIDEHAGTARVYTRANPDGEMTVNVQQLHEQ
jgi:small acid-soluble spore protein H (minor)